MNKLVIGVLAVQGDVEEHVIAMERVFSTKNINGSVRLIRKVSDLIGENHQAKGIAALIIPGGESTTMSRVLLKSGLFDLIAKRIGEHSLPMMGTCAGCILLAKKVVESNEPKGVVSFAAMDIEVARNAFGRQIDSFEVPIQFASFVSPLNAVFIRGPLIKSSWGNSKVLAYLDEKIVAVRQKEFLALSFHPEITRDLRIHEYFLEMVSEQRARVQ